MKPKNPAGWFEIYVNDISRAQQFYETVLDLKLDELPMEGVPGDDFKMLAFPMDPGGEGASGALVKMTGVEAGGNSSLIYFSSEDCAIEAARIEAAGGKIFKQKESIGPYGFIALGFDTEGNMFGLHSQA